MNAHGYLFKGYAGQAAPDYIPSMIGCTAGASNGTNRDAYFEQVEIDDRTITSMAISRWFLFDNGSAVTSDPILAIKGPAGSYYIPKSELEEIAAANQDDDTFDMLAAIFKHRVG